ncbi:TPA: hypothetical protein SLH25_005420 [Klebsiella pneumoniae]|nr:hypothetical protein [Klebsiella pneumoniae]
MTLKTIRFNDEDIEIIEAFMAEHDVSFSLAVKMLVQKHADKVDYLAVPNPPDKTEVSKTGYYIRLYKTDDTKIRKIAKEKGVSVAREIRYRVSSTIGDSVFDVDEALELKRCANEVAKSGRLMNQAIKNNLLVGTKDTRELSTAINALRLEFVKLSDRAMRRIK